MPLNTIPNKGLTSRGYPSDRIADPIIINGDMSVSQRGYTSATAVASANTYYLDRYIGREVTDGALNIEQSTTAPSGFKNSLKITVTTADSSLSATQRAYLLTKIEGNRVAQLAFGTSDARKITLAFYIRASVTGTFSGSITNELENRSFPFTYTINSADTWERKVVNIDADTSGTWDTDNTTGLEIYFSLGMGSTYSGTAGSWAGAQYFAATGASNLIATNGATWHLTGLQLEVGEFDSTTIPSFPFESFESNLKKCERYYEKNAGYSGFFASNSAHLRTTMKTPKRTQSPSISFSNSPMTVLLYGSSAEGSNSGSSGTDQRSISFADNAHHIRLLNQTGTGASNGNGCILTDSQYVIIDAEI
jgi:hypothetical protein